MTQQEIFVRYFAGTSGNNVEVDCSEECIHNKHNCELKKVTLIIDSDKTRQKGFAVRCLQFQSSKEQEPTK